MTQADLAKRVKVDPSAVSFWETGETAPQHPTLIDVVTALGISMAEFYGDAPADAEPKAS